LIDSHPDVDAILLNHALDSVAVRDALAASGDVTAYRPPANMPYPSLGPSARFTRLAEILERGSGSFEPFTHIGTQIFRPEKWRAVGPDCPEYFDPPHNDRPSLLLQ
jgi:hypothetical protein